MTGQAWGPEWQFTVLDAAGLDEVELPLLRILVPGAPERGAVSYLRREDTAARDAIVDGVYEAVQRQRRSFGPRANAKPWIAVGLIVLASLGALGAFVGSIIANAGPYAIAWGLIGGGAVLGAVIGICRNGRGPSAAERTYRQRVRNLEGWMHSTTSIDPRLAGWAMVWNLPGAWEKGLPESIVSLRGRDSAFLRGDFAQRRVPRAIPI